MEEKEEKEEKEPKEEKEEKEPKEEKEKEPKEEKEKEPKEEKIVVSREAYDNLMKTNKELTKKVDKLTQTILHANVEKKETETNPFEGFSRYK